MHRKEANLQNPLRILDRFLRGGLGAGRLGVITASAGVGKSACLVQIGLDALLRDRAVLHVAVGQSVEHVAAWYDALFDELAGRVDLADRGRVREAIAHRRLIWSRADAGFGALALDEALQAYRAHLDLDPAVVLVDGFPWEAPGCTSALRAAKESAARAGAELWMTAPSPTPEPATAAGGEAALPVRGAELVDVGLSLAPHGRWIRVVLVRGAEGGSAVDLPLVLQGGVLRALGRADGGAANAEVDPAWFTLLATGSAGAEEEFGACAERWGVEEVNFTFDGRPEIARTRGLVQLGDDDLKLGEVSAAYVRAHLHRSLPETPVFARILQAIWHQVSSAGEVFAVGSLNPDNTAVGGTGWAVELARHWGKPVHLYDQSAGRWLRWDGRGWNPEAPPVVTRARFAGTGTRSPSAEGREAIRALFERSFGPAPAGR